MTDVVETGPESVPVVVSVMSSAVVERPVASILTTCDVAGEADTGPAEQRDSAAALNPAAAASAPAVRVLSNFVAVWRRSRLDICFSLS
jgi:hypothetical protein